MMRFKSIHPHSVRSDHYILINSRVTYTNKSYFIKQMTKVHVFGDMDYYAVCVCVCHAIVYHLVIKSVIKTIKPVDKLQNNNEY